MIWKKHSTFCKTCSMWEHMLGWHWCVIDNVLVCCASVTLLLIPCSLGRGSKIGAWCSSHHLIARRLVFLCKQSPTLSSLSQLKCLPHLEKEEGTSMYRKHSVLQDRQYVTDSTTLVSPGDGNIFCSDQGNLCPC